VLAASQAVALSVGAAAGTGAAAGVAFGAVQAIGAAAAASTAVGVAVSPGIVTFTIPIPNMNGESVSISIWSGRYAGVRVVSNGKAYDLPLASQHLPSEFAT
jgi:hypothetical protein